MVKSRSGVALGAPSTRYAGAIRSRHNTATLRQPNPKFEDDENENDDEAPGEWRSHDVAGAEAWVPVALWRIGKKRLWGNENSGLSATRQDGSSTSSCLRSYGMATANVAQCSNTRVGLVPRLREGTFYDAITRLPRL
jgi:hypothetical protein